MHFCVCRADKSEILSYTFCVARSSCDVYVLKKRSRLFFYEHNKNNKKTSRFNSVK